MRRSLMPVLAASVALGAAAVGGVALYAQQSTPLDCPVTSGDPGRVISFIDEFGDDMQSGASGGYATAEEAVEAEASALLVAHDPGSSLRQDGLYLVRRDGRPAALFEVVRWANGRYDVEGGDLCDADYNNPL